MEIPTYKAPDGAWYDSPEEYFWMEILGGCGCGTSDILAEEAWAVFDYFAKKEYVAGFFDDNGKREILAHWMSSKDEFFEHGGSVYGTWLTEKGRDLYLKLSKDIETLKENN